MSDPDVTALGGSTTVPAAGIPADPAFVPTLSLMMTQGEFPAEVVITP